MEINEEIWCMTTGVSMNVILDSAPCLRARDYKDPPILLVEIDDEGSGNP